jgi:Uma2 family endonuclease
MTTKARATIEDLYHIPDNGKAELINGEIVLMPPTGYLPGYAASEVLISLRVHERTTKSGHAVGNNVGYKVNLSNRASFSPDASWYTGQPTGMKFLEGVPQCLLWRCEAKEIMAQEQSKRWPTSEAIILQREHYAFGMWIC